MIIPIIVEAYIQQKGIQIIAYLDTVRTSYQWINTLQFGFICVGEMQS